MNIEGVCVFEFSGLEGCEFGASDYEWADVGGETTVSIYFTVGMFVGISCHCCGKISLGV